LSPVTESQALDEEMPFIAEVIKGGRLTIPEEIRKLMRIEEGNYVLIKLKVVSRKRLGSKKPRRNGKNGSNSNYNHNSTG
jgi:bifunctional DNA-binding transcriptional regulator/antitoxin component of YhaV-PrlF toxin-antitoxin module